MKSIRTHWLTALLSPLFLAAVHAGSPQSDAVGWWTFEGNTSESKGKDLTAVSVTASKLEPVATVAYEKVTGLAAGNAGAQSIKLDGASVLKSPDRTLRIGGAQTFWLRVQFAEVPAQEATLIARSRPRTGLYGISLELKSGALAGAVSADGQQSDASVSGRPEPALQKGEWYDIALRFNPKTSLQVDLFSPRTGKKLGSWKSLNNIPSTVAVTNAIGSGYLQIGAMNNGSAGSQWAVPGGTHIEAAGVWDRCLSDQELNDLSAASK